MLPSSILLPGFSKGACTPVPCSALLSPETAPLLVLQAADIGAFPRIGRRRLEALRRG